MVAITPDGDQVGVAAPDLEPQRKLLAICAAAGLDCLDLQPELDAAAGSEKLYFDGAHPNAAGQRVIAAARSRATCCATPADGLARAARSARPAT